MLVQRDAPVDAGAKVASPDSGTKAPAPDAGTKAADAGTATGPTADDVKEFELLKGKIADAAGSSLDTAADYVAARDKFFGSRDAFVKYKAVSDAELGGDKVLASQIELSGDAQKVFYAWVRQAYENQGIKDVPALIKKGMTPELETAIAAVEKAYGKKFAHGGFNPRPVKTGSTYKYQLGTLSPHATGKAVDIQDTTNAALENSDWAWIEKTAGKTADGRDAATWTKDPKKSWQGIHDVNEAFVKAVADAIAAEKARQDKAVADAVAAKTKAPVSPAPEDVVFKDHLDLKPWSGGFFSLDWELVKALADQKMTWGAIWTTKVDLHHFELP